MPQTIQGNVPIDIVKGIAITTLIFAASIYLPVIGLFCFLFIPIPIFFYRSKLGRTTGAIVLVASIIMVIFMIGTISIDIFFFIELLLFGFVLGELIEINLSIEKTILYACALVLSAGLLGLFFYSNISNVEITALISEYVAKNLKLTIALYEKMGMPEENIRFFSNSLENIQYVLLRIIPAMIVVSSFFMAWATLLIAKPILKSRGLFYPDFGSLNLWKVPDSFVWGAIGCGLILILPERGIKMVGLNGLIILMAIYFFQGVAIVSFFFEKKHFSSILKFVLYSLIAIQQVIALIIIGIGFSDIWLNYRKLGIKQKS
ncbi:MAG: YybS family protein [Candidatus Desulfaltia sp.]|nr:YybS family protein [Candidatus Desulfaltia sp.]